VRLIDLSCDLGEAATPEEERVEARLWPLVTSANVACGGHTGDQATMRRAVERARTNSIALGAHPSYPDRSSFGRKRIAISPAALVDSLVQQIRALAAIAGEAGLSVAHVKPHGALYNDAHHDRQLAEAIVAAVARVDRGMAIVCNPVSALFVASSGAGVPAIAEGFADRRYRPDGSLVPRGETDALVLDPGEAGRQAVALAQDGKVSTLCVHSDMTGAVERLQAIRDALSAAGFGFRRVTSADE
jgi:UPF0271 protein